MNKKQLFVYCYTLVVASGTGLGAGMGFGISSEMYKNDTKFDKILGVTNGIFHGAMAGLFITATAPISVPYIKYNWKN